MSAIWSSVLMCQIERLQYCFDEKVGELWLPENNCTDMRGVIKMMTAIDPGVRTIITWAGGKRDTVYFRTGEKWEARG